MAESNKMKEMPVNKLMVQMGIPMILSMALQKNKREICKDKQILMISRFYKPAFSIIIIFFGHIINEKEERMQEKFCLTF